MPSTLILAALGVELTGASLLIARFAINFAVSMIVTRVFSSSAANQNTDNGVRQQVPPATTNSLPIVYGDAYLGGVFVDAVLSTDQKTMYYVLAISQISPNGQFSFDTSKFYWQDQIIGFDGTDPTKVISLTDGAGNVQTKVAGNLFINLYKSNEAGTITALNGTALPSSVMGGTDIDAAQRWPSSGRQMNGLAFAIIKMVYSQDAGTTQMQAVTFHASQYLFGSGVAKPGDVWYDYITNTKYGAAMDENIVDGLTATELNTYSDELITYTPSGGGSATQPRYRINGVLDTGQNVLSNLDQIMLACDSWNQYNAATGKWSIVINKARSTDFAFDDTNIIGEIRVSAYEIAQSINQIEAQFPNKLNRDQAGFVYLNTPTNLLFANEPENKYSLSYSLVNDSVQAQYLANRLLEQAREDLIVTFSTTYNGIQVDAGDVISVTNAAYGWDAKLFRVIKVSEASLPDGNLGAALELNEYNVQVYDNFDITAFTPSPNSNLPSATYFSPLSAPIVSTSNPSSAIPNFDVTISIPSTGRVTSADLFYATSAVPAVSDWKLLSTASTVNGQAVTPGSSYVFANQVLPTGASTTVTYYFAYTVYNEISSSAISAVSSPLVWTPVASAGPTGPTGATGSGTAGLNGLSFINAYKVQSQSDSTPTFTTPTSGSAIPTGWVATAPSVSVGQVMWYIQGRYNSSTSTIDGVAAGTTAWTGPIAASIFQDIRSDNWNGSNPPVASSVSTWGTTGYYISRTDGNMYANGFYARGVMKVNGAVVNPGFDSYTTALDANASASASIGVIGYSNVSTGFGVVGWTENASASVGVNGTSTVVGSTGLLANNTANGIALDVAGKMKISNSTLVANLNAELLNGLKYDSIAAAGTGTGNYAGNTKPSATTTTNEWLKIKIGTTFYYVPAWQ
jgi:hypothetical protein